MYIIVFAEFLLYGTFGKWCLLHIAYPLILSHFMMRSYHDHTLVPCWCTLSFRISNFTWILLSSYLSHSFNSLSVEWRNILWIIFQHSFNISQREELYMLTHDLWIVSFVQMIYSLNLWYYCTILRYLTFRIFIYIW